VTRPRLWPAVVVLLLGALVVLKTWLTGDAIRQQRILQTIATAVLVLLALLVWLAFLSRLSRRFRFVALALVLGLIALTAALVRVRGVTGDLRPIVELRFAKPAAARASSGSRPRGGSRDADSRVARAGFDRGQHAARHPSRDGEGRAVPARRRLPVLSAVPRPEP